MGKLALIAFGVLLAASQEAAFTPARLRGRAGPVDPGERDWRRRSSSRRVSTSAAKEP